MRFATPVLCLGLVACATTSTGEDSTFMKPNDLMGREIEDRITQIPFQHREELFNNLLWLAQTGEQAIPGLLEGLRHENPKVRSNCIWVLGRMRDRRTMGAMQPLTKDPVETVRLEAARTLVLMGDVQHVPELLRGLESNQIQVRYLCHEALKSSTGRDFAYDHLTDNQKARREAIYRWRQWWGQQTGDPFYAQSYATQNGIDPRASAEPQWSPGEVPPAPDGEMAPPDDTGVIVTQPPADQPMPAPLPAPMPQNGSAPEQGR
jgi:hypothetical protein